MKILIFGGTTEGRMFAQAISELHNDRHSVTVSVATSVGAHELADINGIKVIVGRLDEEEMVRLFMTEESGGKVITGQMSIRHMTLSWMRPILMPWRCPPTFALPR